MKGSPKTGTTGERRFVVESQHPIDFADGRMPAVPSTPWLIWFLEHAARAAVASQRRVRSPSNWKRVTNANGSPVARVACS